MGIMIVAILSMMGGLAIGKKHDTGARPNFDTPSLRLRIDRNGNVLEQRPADENQKVLFPSK